MALNNNENANFDFHVSKDFAERVSVVINTASCAIRERVLHVFMTCMRQFYIKVFSFLRAFYIMMYRIDTGSVLFYNVLNFFSFSFLETQYY